MFYLVTAKCGHVGNGRYVEKDFPVNTISRKEAARIILSHSKVKKHLYNAISSVKEISYLDYLQNKVIYQNDIYFKAHTKQELNFEEMEIKYLYKRKKYKSELEFRSRKDRIKYKLKKMKLLEESIYEFVK